MANNKIYIFIAKYTQKIIPATTICLSIFLSTISYKIHNFAILMPLITSITIYYWSIYQPSKIPYILTFLLGILKDIVEVNTLGLNSLCFLFFQAIASSQRKYVTHRSFIVVWTGFAFCLSMLLSLSFLLLKFKLTLNIEPITIIVSKWLISVLAYAPLHYLLSKLNKLIK